MTSTCEKTLPVEWKNLKGVIFDIDGTLVESAEAHYQALKEILQEANYQGATRPAAAARCPSRVHIGCTPALRPQRPSRSRPARKTIARRCRLRESMPPGSCCQGLCAREWSALCSKSCRCATGGGGKWGRSPSLPGEPANCRLSCLHSNHWHLVAPLAEALISHEVHGFCNCQERMALVPAGYVFVPRTSTFCGWSGSWGPPRSRRMCCCSEQCCLLRHVRGRHWLLRRAWTARAPWPGQRHQCQLV